MLSALAPVRHPCPRGGVHAVNEQTAKHVFQLAHERNIPALQDIFAMGLGHINEIVEEPLLEVLEFPLQMDLHAETSRGRMMVKVVPLPTSLATATRPRTGRDRWSAEKPSGASA